jgi:hypothetical protein
LLIALGLADLLAASQWPRLPVVTGMALVGLGATLVSIARFGSARRLQPLVAIHSIIYANLYIVLVGAVCHAALTGPGHGLSWLQASDLLISIAPMTVAARLAIDALTGGSDGAGR